MLKIVTDSSADLPIEVIKKYDITVIPLKLHINGKTYKDSFEYDSYKFYEELRGLEELPTTSQPSPLEFCDVYKSLKSKGATTILSLHLSSKLSGTYQAALLAKNIVVKDGIKVEVIDSKTVSCGLMAIVIAVAKYILLGKSLEECLAFTFDCIRKNKVFVILDTLKYLEKGGRIGKAKAALGTLLNIIPILSLDESGQIIILDKVRGKVKAFKHLVELICSSIPKDKSFFVSIVHSANEEKAYELLSEISSVYDVKESVVNILGPVIGTHAGPKALACALLQEEV